MLPLPFHIVLNLNLFLPVDFLPKSAILALRVLIKSFSIQYPRSFKANVRCYQLGDAQLTNCGM